MGIKQWITWCDEKMQKLGIKDDSEEIKQTQKSKAPAKETEKPKIQDEPAKGINSPLPSNTETLSNKQPAVVAMPVPKIKHDWYQTEAQVCLTILLKNRVRKFENFRLLINVGTKMYKYSIQVVIEIRIKALKNEDVKVNIESTSLSVSAQLPASTTSDGGNREYR